MVGELTTSEVTKIYTAVLLGLPCPIETPEAFDAYERITEEVDAMPDAGCDIPGEIPGE